MIKEKARSALRFAARHKIPLIIVLLAVIAGVVYMHNWLGQNKDVYVLVKSTSTPSPDVLSEDAQPPRATGYASSNPTAGKVVVYITGEVVNPGVYDVDPGSRVNDVLGLAGGGTADADLTKINLAAPVSDGMQITVPKIGDDTPDQPPITTMQSQDSGQAAGGLVNINTADAAQLETLPGIGPATAQAIIEYRASHGAFKNISDIKNVPGIGDSKFDKIKDLITV